MYLSYINNIIVISHKKAVGLKIKDSLKCPVNKHIVALVKPQAGHGNLANANNGQTVPKLICITNIYNNNIGNA